MTHLKENDSAPIFKGINQDNETISLSDYKGKKLILFFYPKDNTPGCSAQSCNLSENYDRLTNLNFEILGVSADGIESHLRFIAKKNLAINLIADTERKIIEDYGVWAEKKAFGKVKMGIVRTTFIISEEGIIEKIIDKVKTKDHTNQILAEMGIEE